MLSLVNNSDNLITSSRPMVPVLSVMETEEISFSIIVEEFTGDKKTSLFETELVEKFKSSLIEK